MTSARARVLLVLLVITSGVVGVLRAPVPAEAVPPPLTPGREGDLDELIDEIGLGAALYGRDCVYCHGVEGEGAFRGPPLTDAGAASAHFWLTTGYMPIRQTTDPIRRSPTPYDDTEIAALIDHVAGFGDGPDVPEVDIDDADLALGGQLYRLHCAACHSATGIGGAMAFSQFAPDLFASTPTQTVGAMLVGPGAMPAFPQGTFTRNELDAIAAYVDYLQQPDDPGGLSLLRAGRVDEGFAAWGLGVAGLVVVSVWIGRRAKDAT
jgi:ubiquinol-cytochrome c reductase cytochrome c subunit